MNRYDKFKENKAFFNNALAGLDAIEILRKQRENKQKKYFLEKLQNELFTLKQIKEKSNNTENNNTLKDVKPYYSKEDIEFLKILPVFYLTKKEAALIGQSLLYNKYMRTLFGNVTNEMSESFNNEIDGISIDSWTPNFIYQAYKKALKKVSKTK